MPDDDTTLFGTLALNADDTWALSFDASAVAGRDGATLSSGSLAKLAQLKENGTFMLARWTWFHVKAV